MALKILYFSKFPGGACHGPLSGSRAFGATARIGQIHGGPPKKFLSPYAYVLVLFSPIKNGAINCLLFVADL